MTELIKEVVINKQEAMKNSPTKSCEELKIAR